MHDLRPTVTPVVAVFVGEVYYTCSVGFLGFWYSPMNRVAILTASAVRCNENTGLAT
jgi:hypothetical protein